MKSSELANEIAADWNAMSKEEKRAATADGEEDLREHRVMKSTSKRTVPIHAFNDACRTLETLEKEVHLLRLFRTLSAN